MVVGATLGAPLRGRPAARDLTFYEPIPAAMAPNPSLDSWLCAVEAVLENVPPEEFAWFRAARWRSRVHESAFGEANYRRGLAPPLAGGFGNPLANGSQAVGRVIVWGLLFPGNAEKAAEYAYLDAAADHFGDAVVGGAWLGALAALVAGGEGLSAALGALPATPGRVLSLGLAQANAGNSLAGALDALRLGVGTSDDQDANATLARVVYALAASPNDFGGAVRAAAGMGGASDQAAMAVGALAAMLTGPESLEDWLRPLGDGFSTGHALRGVDVPPTLEAFAARLAGASAPTPEPPEEGAEQVAIRLPSFPAGSQVRRVGSLRVMVDLPGSPLVHPARGSEAVVTMTNVGAVEAVLDPEWVAPAGWRLASRASGCRIPPGGSASFAVVTAPDDFDAVTADAVHRLRVAGAELEVPLLGSDRWYACGPFPNPEGLGFAKAYRAEDVQRLSEVFNGRSDMPVRWEEKPFAGTVFEIDPLFADGAGVFYLWCRLRMPSAGRYRIVAAAPVGLIVSVDRRRLVSYHDTHVPAPRAVLPYVGEFDAGEETTVLVKVTRNVAPLGPLTVYFLDPDGQIVQPEFLTMPD